MKKIITAGAALVLCLALAAPTAAMADEGDASLSAPVATEQVAPAPETPEAPAEAVTEAVAPVVEAPAHAPEPAPVQEPIAEAVVAPLTQPEEQNEGVCQPQDAHLSPTEDGDLTVETITAPEGKLISGYCVKAGSIKQGNGPEVVVVDPAVSTLTFSHSSGKDISHYTVTYTDVPPPVEVTPRSCLGAGAWYTEGDDLPPIQGDAGLVFNGGSGKAVGIRVPVTGNLQGWSALSFVNTGGQEQFFFRIVVDLSADGGPAYKSLSFPGYTTIDSSSVAYQYGKTIAELAVLFPNNVITSVGFQTNSGAPAGYVAVLQSVTGPCASADFSDPLPENWVDEGEWTLTTPATCDEPVETWTRVTTVYTYSRDEQGVVVESTETYTDTDSYSLTDEEIAELCPVTPPPVEEEPPAEEKPKPVPAKSTPDALAVTGSSEGSVSPFLFGGLLLLIAGVASASVAAVRRR